MRHPPQTVSGGTTNVVIDAYGSARHGFWDGSPELWDATLGVNGDATEVVAQWFNDVTLNLKNTCIEGNGADGPAGDDTDDDPFELTKSVNSAANVLTGEASFVASGLRFTTDPADFDVTLSAGITAFEGRRYHVTAAKLNAIVVEVDGNPSGTGNAFTLIASRDHYVSIGPLADDHDDVIAAMGSVFTITVTDVANGAAAPAVPGGHFVFAMLATDGSGVTGTTYHADGPRLQSRDTSEIALRPSPDGPGVGHIPAAFHKVWGTAILLDLGYTVVDSDEGRFDTAYLRGLDIRSDALSTLTYAENQRYTRNASIAGGASANVDLLDAADYPDGTAAFVEVKGAAIDPSDPTDSYSFRIECHVHQDGGATWQLDGSGGAPAFEDGNGGIAAGMTVAFNVSGGVLRLGITGHGTDATRWFMEVHYVLLGD